MNIIIIELQNTKINGYIFTGKVLCVIDSTVQFEFYMKQFTPLYQKFYKTHLPKLNTIGILHFSFFLVSYPITSHNLLGF